MNLSQTIDTLGHLQAQIADLTKRADVLKAQIKSQGEGAFEGALFRATVSVSDRETLDMAAVREKLSHQFIAAHTRITPVITVKLVARTAAHLSVAA